MTGLVPVIHVVICGAKDVGAKPCHDDDQRLGTSIPPHRRNAYRAPTGTTLMLLNGEPLISLVLTTV